MVGLMPWCATTIIEKSMRERIRRRWATRAGPHARIPETQSDDPTHGVGHLGVKPSAGSWHRQPPRSARGSLQRCFDENEFLSPYGIRSLSKFHSNIRTFPCGRPGVPSGYMPAESNTGSLGGNSNWGDLSGAGECAHYPGAASVVLYYGAHFKIECHTGTGKLMNLFGGPARNLEPATRMSCARAWPNDQSTAQ